MKGARDGAPSGSLGNNQTINDRGDDPRVDFLHPESITISRAWLTARKSAPSRHAVGAGLCRPAHRRGQVDAERHHRQFEFDAAMMSAAAIARALKGHRSGQGYVARSPAHDDRNPSLSIRDGDNGRLLVHCFKGCSSASVVAALSDMGLWRKGGHPSRCLVASTD